MRPPINSRRQGLLVVLVAATVWLAGCVDRFETALAPPRAGRLLNGRAAVVYSSRYEIDLFGMENKHSFDIHKYRRMAEALVRQGYMTTDDFFVPQEATTEQLLLVHTPAYLGSLRSSKTVGRCLESKEVGLLPAKTTEDRVLRAFRYSTGGTVLAARLAVRCGLGINLGGGYHHAHPDHGEGFCIYADVPVAIRALQKEGLIRRALLVDLDVHQGNGNAVCFADDDDVFTFSIHEAGIYPMPKARSDLDIELRPPVDDARYMDMLRQHLPRLMRDTQPDLVILLAGVDVYREDPLAHFGLTARGIVERDEYVVRRAREHNVPVLYVTSGGYSAEAWSIQYQSIANLLREFADVLPEAPASNTAVGKTGVKAPLKGGTLRPVGK